MYTRITKAIDQEIRLALRRSQNFQSAIPYMTWFTSILSNNMHFEISTDTEFNQQQKYKSTQIALKQYSGNFIFDLSTKILF